MKLKIFITSAVVQNMPQINWIGIKDLKMLLYIITVNMILFDKSFNGYLDGLPSSAFFGSLERDSCVIIDDQFDEAIKESSIRQAFKVDRRHSKFSIVLISQSIFDNGKLSKGIRNNCEVWVLFKNFG